jgi:hypothetical protein
VRQKKIVPLLGKARGYAGKAIEAPGGCLFIDWKLGPMTLQLRANLSGEDVALPTMGLVDRVFPENDMEASHLSKATVQVFIR